VRETDKRLLGFWDTAARDGEAEVELGDGKVAMRVRLALYAVRKKVMREPRKFRPGLAAELEGLVIQVDGGRVRIVKEEESVVAKAARALPQRGEVLTMEEVEAPRMEAEVEELAKRMRELAERGELEPEGKRVRADYRELRQKGKGDGVRSEGQDGLQRRGGKGRKEEDEGTSARESVSDGILAGAGGRGVQDRGRERGSRQEDEKEVGRLSVHLASGGGRGVEGAGRKMELASEAGRAGGQAVDVLEAEGEAGVGGGAGAEGGGRMPTLKELMRREWERLQASSSAEEILARHSKDS
jgi:hypothetical protein